MLEILENIRDMIQSMTKLIIEHAYDMGILKDTAEDKKKNSIIDDILISVLQNGIDIDKLKECIDDVNKDKVLNTDFFIKGGNIDDFINPKWLNFAKYLWGKTPKGLGTPNAACGEGELMFIFLSHRIVKPTKGDLKVIYKDFKTENIELKAKFPRINSNITGKEFRNKTLTLLEKYDLKPNLSNVRSKELYAVEIEKLSQYNNYWKEELNKLNIFDQKLFIIEWLKCVNPIFKSALIEKIFINDEFNHNLFLKEIVKLLFDNMLNNREFDSLMLLDDGTNCKIIRGNQEDFDYKIDNNIIRLDSDYFRINQDSSIGWYIS